MFSSRGESAAVTQVRDELTARIAAGLQRGKREDDSGETGSQWQVYSVFCSQSMGSSICPDRHTLDFFTAVKTSLQPAGAVSQESMFTLKPGEEIAHLIC